MLQGRTWSPLSPDFRESLTAVARQVGADEDTVRYRMRKIEESGFIREWRLLINPRLWGGGQISALFRVGSGTSKQDFVDKLRLVPGVVFVTAFYDHVGVFLDYDDALTVPRSVELIRQLSGVQDLFIARTAFPECSAVLTARDWDLLRALRKEPRKSYAELGAEVGLSGRTARIRLSRLLTAGVAFAWPLVDMRAVHEGLFVHLIVWHPRERKAEVDASLMAHVEPYLWHLNPMLPYRPEDLWPCGYDLFVPNMSLAREVLSLAKAVPGVEKAQIQVHENIFNFPEAYDEELDRKLRSLPGVVRKARWETKGSPPFALKPA